MYQERSPAKIQEILERKATLTSISRDIEGLKSKMRLILDKAPELRPLVDVRNCRWRHKEAGNMPGVAASGTLSTTGTGSITLPETREELEKLISQQMLLVRSLLGMTIQRRKRLRQMVKKAERFKEEQSPRASEEPHTGSWMQAAKHPAAENVRRHMEEKVRNAEEQHRAAQEVMKVYRQKLREMTHTSRKRLKLSRAAKSSSLTAGPSVAAEAQSTSDTDVSDAGKGGNNAGSTSLPGDVRPAPQRGASEGRLASDTSAATPTPRQLPQSHSGRRKQKGQGERDVPPTVIPLTGNGTRCHPGRETVDGAGFSDVMSEHMYR
ncbi:UNVERIFIED_CONTAM: hypothetical protein HHA_454500, partial [Hammondia hammondi]